MSREMMGGGADPESQDDLLDEQEKKEGSPLTAEKILSSLSKEELDQLKNALELTERAESLPAKETEGSMIKQGLNEGDKFLETARSCGIISEEEKKEWKATMDIATLCGAALGVILDTALVTSSDIPMVSFNPYIEGIVKVVSIAACAYMGGGLGRMGGAYFLYSAYKERSRQK